MTSRERLLLTLQHKEPDRIPLDIGVGRACGITVNAYRNLLSWLGVRKDTIDIKPPLESQLARIDEGVLRQLKVDVRGISLKPPSNWELKIVEEDDFYWYKDEWGIKWKMPKQRGYYYDIMEHPLRGATETQVKQYLWPNPCDSARIKGLKEEVRKRRQRTDVALLLAVPLANGFLQMGVRLEGFEDWFTDLATESRKVNYIMDKILDLKLRFYDFLLSNVGEYIDVIFEADDLGMQTAPLISLEMYRKYIKPRQKKLFSFIKSKTSVYVALHSDGSIYDFIPEFIETGVDILNPVQMSAAKMDLGRLKREFGRDLTFWGGGIDTQNTLPTATPEEVRDEVRGNIETLAPGGGYVFAANHNIQPDVPPKNIMAMWEAWKDYGAYS